MRIISNVNDHPRKIIKILEFLTLGRQSQKKSNEHAQRQKKREKSISQKSQSRTTKPTNHKPQNTKKRKTKTDKHNNIRITIEEKWASNLCAYRASLIESEFLQVTGIGGTTNHVCFHLGSHHGEPPEVESTPLQQKLLHFSKSTLKAHIFNYLSVWLFIICVSEHAEWELRKTKETRSKQANQITQSFSLSFFCSED